MFSFHFDDATGILEVGVAGLWTPEVVDRYAAEFGAHAAAARDRAGRLKMLVDCTHALVAPQDAAVRMQDLQPLHREGDRVAVLVVSSLAKLQAKRVLDGWCGASVFVSDSAARIWLQARDAETGPLSAVA